MQNMQISLVLMPVAMADPPIRPCYYLTPLRTSILSTLKTRLNQACRRTLP